MAGPAARGTVKSGFALVARVLGRVEDVLAVRRPDFRLVPVSPRGSLAWGRCRNPRTVGFVHAAAEVDRAHPGALVRFVIALCDPLARRAGTARARRLPAPGPRVD
jgi:hypothetical protein